MLRLASLCLLVLTLIRAESSTTITLTQRAHPRISDGFATVLRVSGHVGDTVLEVLRLNGTATDKSHSRSALTQLPATIWTAQSITAWWGFPSMDFEVLGLRANTEYLFEVAATIDGEQKTAQLTFTTGSAPPLMPEFEVEMANNSAMQSGWTWTSAFPYPGFSVDDSDLYWTGSIILDDSGSPVWAIDCDSLFKATEWEYLNNHWCGITGTQSVLNNGRFLVLWNVYGAMVRIEDGFCGLAEVDWSGTVHKMWVSTRNVPRWSVPLLPKNAVQVDTMVLNHQVDQLPNGNLIGIGFDSQQIQCDAWGSDAPTNVFGNEIVEFDFESGEIYNRWSMFPILDPCKSADPVEMSYNGEWTHLNAFDVVEDRNELIVSSFYLGWIIAVRYRDDDAGKAGDLLWVMGQAWGNPETNVQYFATLPHFDLVRPEESTLSPDQDRWDPGQHNVGVVPNTNGSKILCFDNSAYNERDMGVPSRLVIYEIETRPEAIDSPGKASVAWSYVDGGMSPFLGGSEFLANGNVLGDFGALADPNATWDNRASWAADNCNYFHIVEISPDDDIVFSVKAGGRDESGECGGQTSTRSWNSYRAKRIETPAFA